MKKIISLFAAGLLSLGAFAQEVIMPSQPSRGITNLEELDRGYWLAAEATCMPTLMHDMTNFVQAGISLVNGYRFNEFFKAGVGVGLVYMTNVKNVNDGKPRLYVPLFLELRGDILSSKIYKAVPYWNVDFGYQFGNGLMANVGPGLRVGEKRNAFTVSAGYAFLQVPLPADVANYSGVFVRVGYEF